MPLILRQREAFARLELFLPFIAEKEPAGDWQFAHAVQVRIAERP
jgi:hypothetical protein